MLIPCSPDPAPRQGALILSPLAPRRSCAARPTGGLMGGAYTDARELVAGAGFCCFLPTTGSPSPPSRRQW